MFTLKKLHLSLREWKVEAFCFLPTTSQPVSSLAVFTHGYTAHKGTILNWGVQLASKNIPTIIFDLPGHYLGSFNEVLDFAEYDQFVHQFFAEAFNYLLQEVNDSTVQNVIIGGHSMGALMSLRASTLQCFNKFNRIIIPVGYGISSQGKSHPLQEPFFKPFLKIRQQLVSPALAPAVVLPWLETTKRSIICTGEVIHIISGTDDVIITADAANRIITHLGKNNTVTYDLPSRLPHHQPELAIKYILRFLKKNLLLPKS